MDAFRLVRPLFLVTVGWYMATRRMLKRHSGGTQPGVVLLHPAYAFFYTMFTGAVFVLLFQHKDKRSTRSCEEYFRDTSNNFGFITDAFVDASGEILSVANVFLIRVTAVALAQTLTAYIYAWLHRPKTGKIKTPQDMETFLIMYSVYAFVAGMIAFGLTVIADILLRSGVSAVGSPCG